MTQIAADIDAEAAVLSLLLFNPRAVEALPATLRPEDFHHPRYHRLFDAILTCIAEHGVVDIPSMRLPEDLEAEINEMMRMPAATLSLMGRYAERISEAASHRRLVHMLSDASDAVMRMDTPPQQIIEDLVERAASHFRDQDDTVEGLMLYDDWANMALSANAPKWLVRGLIRERSRTMVVAPEGGSKSVLCRQVAVCAAAGIHPFTGRDIEPVRVLVVDLENDPQTAVDPDDGWIDPASPLGVMMSVEASLERRGRTWDRKNFFTWWRPDGINLCSASDVDKLERVIRQTKPQLITFGPIYKSYVRRDREDDETLGARLQTTLDRLRLKHNCAWLFEHHAPHGDTNRRFRPFGTSLWLRWPDIGIMMHPDYDDELHGHEVRILSRFRGDRFKVDWPERLRFGRTMPFVEAGR